MSEFNVGDRVSGVLDGESVTGTVVPPGGLNMPGRDTAVRWDGYDGYDDSEFLDYHFAYSGDPTKIEED